MLNFIHLHGNIIRKNSNFTYIDKNNNNKHTYRNNRSGDW